MEASTDDGASWTTLTSTTAPPFLFPALSWDCLSIDVSDYAGEDLLLRFGFDTGGPIGADFPGFYLDNLLVEAEGFDGTGVSVPCGATGFPVYESDFESDDGDYSLTGLWHRSAACAALNPSHDSEYGLYFGVDDSCTYDTGMAEVGEATSPSIHLEGTSGLILLSLRYHLETDQIDTLDLATLEISNDGGQRWFELASSEAVPQFEDGGGLWKCGLYNISAYAGGTIQIRLTFDSVLAALNGFGGFFVDDLRITSSQEPPLFADGFESGDTSRWSP